jgi:hypothetical protein
MDREARPECLDKLSRAVAPSIRNAPKANGWIFSETTSPVDYSPIATAMTASHDGLVGSEIKLLIRCRGGRTELSLSGPGISGRGDDYMVSYRVYNDEPVQVAAAASAYGPGIAIVGDVVRLLQSLPDNVNFVVHLSSRVGAAHNATFSLAGLDAVRTKMAGFCKWPVAVARPGN